jgi:hypothetical protein
LPGLSTTLTPLVGGPITTPTYGLHLPDASKPFTIQATATSPSTDNNGGVLYVTKDTSYGSLTATGGQYSAIFGLNIVREGVWTNQDGILGSIYNYNTGNSQPGGSASGVAVYGTAWCMVTGCSATWASVLAVYDISGQSNPSHPLIGLEIDVYAHGPDTGNRVGLQIATGTPDGAGVAPTVGSGILIGGNFLNIFNATGASTVNGIDLNGATISGQAWLSPGASIDGTGNSTFQSVQLNSFAASSLPPCGAPQRGKIIYVINASTAASYNNPVPTATGTNEGKALCRNSTWVWG